MTQNKEQGGREMDRETQAALAVVNRILGSNMFACSSADSQPVAHMMKHIEQSLRQAADDARKEEREAIALLAWAEDYEPDTPDRNGNMDDFAYESVNLAMFDFAHIIRNRDKQENER